MTISQTQIVDILYKKLSGVSKTDTSTAKSPANEANSSPQLSPGSTIWQQDYLIPGVTTLPASNSSVVTVYRQSLSSAVQATSLSESVANETWTTGLTNWIPPQFGAGYQLKLYAGPPGSSTPENFTNLPVGGSGNNDSWYFDYIAGIVNFADTNVPTAAANVANVVYVEGARYTGQTGITSFVSNISFGNITIGNSASVGGTFTVSGPVAFGSNASVSGNLFVGGNISISGNTNTITSNVGVFYGNAAGFGALYAGISNGYVYQPQTVLQNSTNFNGYAQVNHQNINNGASASTDYVATADAGTAGAGYIDMGINSSGFVNGTGNELNYPLDGYLYAQGTTGINGNLILATGTTADIVFTTGGFSTAYNYQGRFKNNVGLILAQTTQSSGTTTGALVIAGGVGIASNVNIGGNLTHIGTSYGNISADTITPYQTTVTTFNSTTAIGLPTGGNVSRPSSPISGQIRYNSDINSVEYYNNAGWISVTSSISDQNFYGDGANATFTLNQTTTEAGILVSINGTIQQPGYAYAVVGNQITFSQTPLLTDQIDIRFLASATATSVDTAIIDTAPVVVGSTTTTIDSWSLSSYRSAKYIISSNNGTDSQLSEIRVIHDGTTSFVNADILKTGTNTMTFSTTISSGLVLLQAISTTTNNQIRIQKVYFVI
jgi:predicted acyltransferase (DUF342 family)